MSSKLCSSSLTVQKYWLVLHLYIRPIYPNTSKIQFVHLYGTFIDIKSCHLKSYKK